MHQQVMISAVFLIAVSAQTLAAVGVVITDPIVRIHARQWDAVSEDDAVALLGRPSERQAFDVPEGSQYRTDDCSGAVHLTASYADASITMEFDQYTRPGSPCGTRLHAVRVEAEGDRRMLEALEQSVLTAIGANGIMEEGEFQWRSDDSQTRFVLYTSIASGREGKQASLLRIRLLHRLASPDEIADLPPPKRRRRPSFLKQ